MKGFTRAWWRANWGFGIFAIDAILSMLSLLRGRTGHYVNYTAPAVHLWGGNDPYGITFPGSPGAFFYSPGCALYFYGLFGFLPDLLGQFLYMSLCLVVFWFGLQSLLKTLKEKFQFDLDRSSYRHLFWLMAGSEVLGSIIAVKIDLLIVGITFWLAAALMRERRVAAALFITGIVTSWKLHPLMVVGLLMVISVLMKKLAQPVIYFAGIVVGMLSPFIVLPAEFALKVTQHWLSSLHEFVSHSWLSGICQHLYGFVARTFHINIESSLGDRITSVLGLLAAIYLAVIFRRLQKKDGMRIAEPLGYLIAVGMGSAFVAMFAQLIQSNSYVVYLPLPLAFIVCVSIWNWDKRWVYGLLIATYLIVSIAYSDFCPRPLYRILYYTGVKPLGVLLLFSALLLAAWRGSQLTPTSRPAN